MKNAIIYTRVSTDEQAQKGYSLRDQEDKLRTYCEQRDIKVITHFGDHHSAKTFERPSFKNLEAFATSNKSSVDYVLIVKWDRFSRHAGNALNVISKFKKLGIEINATEQWIDFSIPESKIILGIFLSTPEVENDRRALNTSNGMRRAMKEGRYVSTAPFGYSYHADIFNKPALIPNEKAHLVKKAFEMYAEGPYDKEEIRRMLKGEGMTLTKSPFNKMFHRDIYCGKIKIQAYGNEEEETVNGIHEAIISEELFRKVQLRAKSKSKIKYKPKTTSDFLPLRGYLICPSCATNLTGSASKGNGGQYFYYHCQPGCKERHSAKKLHDNFEDYLGTLRIKPELTELYLAIMEDLFKTNEGDREREIVKLENEVTNNLKRLDQATDKFIDGDLDKENYNRHQERLKTQNLDLALKIDQYKQEERGFDRYLKYGITLLSNLKEYYTSATTDGKQKILGLIFSEKLIFESGNYRTNEGNELLSLIYTLKGVFKGNSTKKGQHISDLSRMVARRGIEPLFPG